MPEGVRAARLTKAQWAALRSLILWSGPGGVYMPYAGTMRSFEACERRGLVEWVRVEDGHPRNGYRITPAGRALFSETDHA